MSAFTAKNYQIKKAPKRIELLGDKTKRPEPAQHIIEFPGGAIEVSRCSDGNYWAHILINRTAEVDDAEGFHARLGKIVGTRVWREGIGLSEIDDVGQVSQIAVLIGAAA